MKSLLAEFVIFVLVVAFIFAVLISFHREQLRECARRGLSEHDCFAARAP